MPELPPCLIFWTLFYWWGCIQRPKFEKKTKQLKNSWQWWVVTFCPILGIQVRGPATRQCILSIFRPNVSDFRDKIGSTTAKHSTYCHEQVQYSSDWNRFSSKPSNQGKHLPSNFAIVVQSSTSPRTACTCGWLTTVVNHRFTLPYGARKDGSSTFG